MECPARRAGLGSSYCAMWTCVCVPLCVHVDVCLYQLVCMWIHVCAQACGHVYMSLCVDMSIPPVCAMCTVVGG